MIRRLFGIGRKKQKPIQPSGASNNSVLLADNMPGATQTTPDGSVVPLRTTELPVKKKKDTAEVLNEAVNRLVEKLEGINDNLDSQIKQNQQLVERMDALPKAVEQQRQAFSDVAVQLRQKLENDENVARELSGIHEKITTSAEIDRQMAQNFSGFSETLSKLDNDTVCQTEWIQQMSKTFSASERYIKYTLAKQQMRFYWVFGIALGVSFFAIVGLIIGIVLLTSK